MDIEKVKAEARKEIDEEDFRAAVDKCKAQMRAKRTFWDKIFPYKIIITRKDKVT